MDLLRRSRAILPTLTALLWLLLTGVSLLWLADYENLAGDPGQPELSWAGQSSLSLSPVRPTLVMFAHPRCPCTRASISELAVLMAQCDSRLSAYVVFVRPPGTDLSWSQSDLWVAASRIPNVEVFSDAGGIEIRRFGAATSGQVLVYSPDGDLLFQGGITSSRGHAGDNSGRSSILQLLKNAAPQIDSVTCHTGGPVFGCPLVD